MPAKEVFHEFFWLFTDRSQEVEETAFKNMMNINGNTEKTYLRFMQAKLRFTSYEEFLNYCLAEKTDNEERN